MSQLDTGIAELRARRTREAEEENRRILESRVRRDKFMRQSGLWEALDARVIARDALDDRVIYDIALVANATPYKATILVGPYYNLEFILYHDDGKYIYQFSMDIGNDSNFVAGIVRMLAEVIVDHD